MANQFANQDPSRMSDLSGIAQRGNSITDTAEFDGDELLELDPAQQATRLWRKNRKGNSRPVIWPTAITDSNDPRFQHYPKAMYSLNEDGDTVTKTITNIDPYTLRQDDIANREQEERMLAAGWVDHPDKLETDEPLAVNVEHSTILHKSRGKSKK